MYFQIALAIGVLTSSIGVRVCRFCGFVLGEGLLGRVSSEVSSEVSSDVCMGEGSQLFLDSFWVGQGQKIDDTFPCYLGSMVVKFFSKGVWASGCSRSVWNMDGCFFHCMIAV